MKSIDSFQTKKTIHAGGKDITIFSLSALQNAMDIQLSRLPFSLRILLENLLRYEDGKTVNKEDIEALVRWDSKVKPNKEIAFVPARVLLQDFTGVPCIVDLAVMRDAMIKLGGDPNKINPIQPVDLVIDHSVQVDEYGTSTAFKNNATLEFERNRERYAFLDGDSRHLKISVSFHRIPVSFIKLILNILHRLSFPQRTRTDHLHIRIPFLVQTLTRQ